MTEPRSAAAPRADRSRAPVERELTAVPPTPSTYNRQVQGLRAVAVGTVVAYHFWPDVVRGGYVGVDVFFVISGFLITAHLVRELESSGRIGLLAFWARRARRLLPASMTVLAACAAFVLLAMPALTWAQNLGEIRASALYFQNWQLAADAVDYLGAENAPSVVQHFWSLSVEEQFYLVAPVLLLVAFAAWKTRRAIVALLVTVVVVSGAYSVVLTSAQPGVSYFSTGTRAWEFAAGGLVAVLPLLRRRSPRLRAALAWLGLTAIGAAVLFYDHSTPFPGWTAVLPVAGTVLVLVAGDRTASWGPDRLLQVAPMQRLGDWSYSIYLWHWPLLIAVPVLLGVPMGWKHKLVVLAVVVVLAALTKRLIEDRFRGLPKRRPLLRTYPPMAVVAAALVILTTAGGAMQAQAVEAQAARAARTLAEGPQRCVGIGAIVNDCDDPYAVTETTIPAVAADDVPWNRGVPATEGCHAAANTDGPAVRPCVFGAKVGATRTIALVGDSHADHLIDALNGYARLAGWRLVTYTREGCGGVPSSAIENLDCRAWSENVQRDLVVGGFDAVLYSSYQRLSPVTAADAEVAWAALRSAGSTVVPIEDVPGMPVGVTAPDCVAANLAAYDPCTGPLPRDGYVQQAAAALDLPTVGVNDLLCRGGVCHSVIGGLIVYMDDDHFTLSFAQTLSQVIGQRISALLPAR